MGWSGGTYTQTDGVYTGDGICQAQAGDGDDTIYATEMDALFEDHAAAINQCINKDGTNAFTGAADLGLNKIVNLSAPTSSNDAANKLYVDTVAPSDIGDLDDVSSAGPSTDEVLTWTGSQWEPSSVSGSFATRTFQATADGVVFTATDSDSEDLSFSTSPEINDGFGVFSSVNGGGDEVRVNASGRYRVCVDAPFVTTSTTQGYAQASLYKNGVEIYAAFLPINGSTRGSCILNYITDFLINDKLDFQVLISTDANVTLSSVAAKVNIERVA